MLIAGLHYARLRLRCDADADDDSGDGKSLCCWGYATNDTSLQIGIKSLKLKHKTQEQVKVNLIESCVSCFFRICNIISE